MEVSMKQHNLEVCSTCKHFTLEEPYLTAYCEKLMMRLYEVPVCTFWPDTEEFTPQPGDKIWVQQYSPDFSYDSGEPVSLREFVAMTEDGKYICYTKYNKRHQRELFVWNYATNKKPKSFIESVCTTSTGPGSKPTTIPKGLR